MEIKITIENLAKILWRSTAVLAAIGFLLALVGLVVALTLNANARIGEAVLPVALIVAGCAIAVTPWCLAHSLSKISGEKSANDDSSHD